MQVSRHREQVTHIKSLRDAIIPHNRPLGMYAHHTNRESPFHKNNSEKTFMMAATKIGCKKIVNQTKWLKNVLAPDLQSFM